MFQDFEIKDLVFLGLISATLLLLGGLIMPLVMSTQLFGLQQLLSAPFFALLTTLALHKVPKRWSLPLLGLMTGSVLLFMSAVMFFNNVLAALLAEGISLARFKDYENDQAKLWASLLWIPCTLPITFLFMYWFQDRGIAEQLAQPWLSALLIAGSFLFSYLGARLGASLSQELKKAGKL